MQNSNEANKKQKIDATNNSKEGKKVPEQASQSTNSPKRRKMLAGRSARASPLKNGGKLVPKYKQNPTSGVSHGGTMKPFKAPSTITSKGPLDVQPVRGQKFTSLKNLEAAAMERKNKGNKI